MFKRYVFNEGLTNLLGSNGKIYIANDSASMAKLLNINRKAIRKASYTRGNQLYKGYRFRLGATTEL